MEYESKGLPSSEYPLEPSDTVLALLATFQVRSLLKEVADFLHLSIALLSAIVRYFMKLM
jgi:hypothetical protein